MRLSVRGRHGIRQRRPGAHPEHDAGDVDVPERVRSHSEKPTHSEGPRGRWGSPTEAEAVFVCPTHSVGGGGVRSDFQKGTKDFVSYISMHFLQLMTFNILSNSDKLDLTLKVLTSLGHDLMRSAVSF